jgi:hypothetical protein
MKSHHTRSAVDLRRKIAALPPPPSSSSVRNPSPRSTSKPKNSRLNQSILPPPFAVNPHASTSSTASPPHLTRSNTSPLLSSDSISIPSSSATTPLAKQASAGARARRELDKVADTGRSEKGKEREVDRLVSEGRKPSGPTSPTTSSFPMGNSSLYGSSSSSSDRQTLVEGSYLILKGEQTDPFQRFWGVIEGSSLSQNLFRASRCILPTNERQADTASWY